MLNPYKQNGLPHSYQMGEYTFDFKVFLKTLKILKFKILNPRTEPSLRMYENIRVSPLDIQYSHNLVAFVSYRVEVLRTFNIWSLSSPEFNGPKLQSFLKVMEDLS